MRYLERQDGAIWHFKTQTFGELRGLLEDEIKNTKDYVFRGLGNTDWSLDSTLNRLIQRARLSGAKEGPLEQFVEEHFKLFKSEIRGRRGNNPPTLEDDELWALGQHYGLATPLLDWSRSPYIALFFALESMNENEENRALWCLNEEEVERKNLELSDEQQLKLIFPDTDENKRLLGQSGLFSKGPVMVSVDNWVRERFHDSAGPVLLK